METSKKTTEKTAELVTKTVDKPAQFMFTWKHFWIDLIVRFSSRRLWMTIFAVSVPWLGLERGVDHLYALQPQTAIVYGSMFLCVMGAITVVVSKFVGIENISASSSSSVTGAINTAANITANLTEALNKPKPAKEKKENE